MAILAKLKTHSFAQKVTLILLDAAFVNIAFVLALQLRFDMRTSPTYLFYMAMYTRYVWPGLTITCLVCFSLTKMYRRLWTFAGVQELLSLVLATGLCMGLMMGVNEYIYRSGMFNRLFPRTVFPVAWMLLICFSGGFRLLILMWDRFARYASSGMSARKRVLVVGAGYAGATVIREFTSRRVDTSKVVCVVDDDPSKENSRIGGFKVSYGIDNVPDLVEQMKIDEIVVAVPSATPEQLRRILKICTSTECKIQLIPVMKDVTDDAIHVSALRDVNINDLLSREEVHLDKQAIEHYLTNKTVLVTGGGGSIGSELCRQIAQFHPAQIIIFDIYENNAYELQSDLKLRYGDALKIQVLVGSVRDMERLEAVFEKYRPDVVFHAAAHKHVPLMEDSPAEAIKNNIGGTMNVAICADKYGANRFVMPSTDKAVNPTNVMGASKRVAEIFLQRIALRSKTQYMVVRFGNVLGSNGSVIPLFKSQIAAGGPVTVTHPDITRYFMTIPEAAQLVLQACAANESGKVYVLDMGTPVKIIDLARNLIHLAGYQPGEDIKIVFSGLRPGEKLYEELLRPEEQEGMMKTAHEKIFVAPPLELDEEEFHKKLEHLLETAHQHPENVRVALKDIVPEYVETSN